MLAGIPVLFAAIGLLQSRIDAHTLAGADERQLLLRSGSVVKNLSLGYAPLLADLYWTRVVQYYGSRVGIPGTNFDLLWPLLDVTTTLDPKLVVAYRFGSIFLSEPDLAGPGRTDLAVELVKRGIAANPNEWRLDAESRLSLLLEIEGLPASRRCLSPSEQKSSSRAYYEDDGGADYGEGRIPRDIALDMVRVIFVHKGSCHSADRAEAVEGAKGSGGRKSISMRCPSNIASALDIILPPRGK